MAKHKHQITTADLIAELEEYIPLQQFAEERPHITIEGLRKQWRWRHANGCAARAVFLKPGSTILVHPGRYIRWLIEQELSLPERLRIQDRAVEAMRDALQERAHG